MRYIFMFLFAALIVTGCGDKKEETPANESANKYAFDTTDLATTKIENAGGQASFRYKYETGEKYSYRITTISEDRQKLVMDSTVEQTIKQTVIYLFNFEPVEKDNDGTIELNCNISSIKLDASSGNQNLAYESGKTTDSAETSRYSEYESMVNNPFSIRISEFGEILEIFRVDKIVNKYLDIKGYRDSLSSQEKTMIRGDLTEGVLRPLAVQVFRQMPSKPVAKDSTWRLAQNPTRFMVFEIANTNIYKVAGLEMLEDDTLAKLEATLSTVISGESKATDRGVIYEFKKPVTSADGTIFFNMTDGLIEKSRTSTTIVVSYTMEADTPQGRQKGSRTENIRNMNIVERL